MCESCKNGLVLELLDRAIDYASEKIIPIEEASDSIAYAYESLCDVVDENSEDEIYIEINDNLEDFDYRY